MPIKNNEVTDHIDKLLASLDNLNELVEYVKNNSEATECINNLLYNIASNSNGLNKNIIQKSEILLRAGANPNYICNDESILQAAAYNGMGTFIELLIQYGADVVMYVPKKPIEREDWKEFGLSDTEIDSKYAKEENRIAKMSLLDKTKDMIRLSKLPVQRAFSNLINHQNADNEASKACKILSQKTISALNIEEQLTEIFHQQYKLLETYIKAAIQEASTQNIQLLIMVGEQHSSLQSLIIELMVILIASSNGIHTILTEHNKFIDRCINQSNFIPTNEKKWSVTLTINEQRQALSMSSIPVDLGHWGAKKIGPRFDDYEDLKKCSPEFSNTTHEGIKYRDRIISDVITNGIKEHAALLVGCAHLEGLLEKNPLPTDKFYVIAINSAEIATLIQSGKERKEACFKFAYQSSRVLQPLVKLEEFIPMLSPETVVNLVMKLHAMVSPKQHDSTVSNVVSNDSFFKKKDKSELGHAEENYQTLSI